MPSLLATTQAALDGERMLEHCNSRSLRLTRYALPDLKEDIRKGYLQRAVDSERHDAASTSFLNWTKSLAFATRIHARLEARLLLNMAGSVMENAGLLLDRYGIAYIPGSAVKGCARRAALATLRQWCETGEKPIGDDLFAPAAAPFAEPADLLMAILRVFGCTDLEWEGWNDENDSGNDLAWACSGQWETLRDHARAALNSGPGLDPDEPKPTRRGAISFLPAYPSKLPTKDLELDVLTPHHKNYYSEPVEPDLPHTDQRWLKWEKEHREWEAKFGTAPDTEDPVPVFFPAVAQGAEYAFALLPLGTTPADSPLFTYAKTWLATGLTVFGLGAKTSAGYGVFNSEDFDSEQARCIEYAAKFAELEKEAAIKNTPADETVLSKLRTLKEDALRGELNKYAAEERFWPASDTFRTRLTLFRYFTSENTALWEKERANPKSKITKAITALAQHLNAPL